ncbi:hypothetical protein [Polaribacter marinivivus]|uniref:GTP-binding protein n=1 Tax=Polaribacter marinivivus TaxID=1524260 RepID=A0ABV8RBZ8_9FLAO
MDNFLKRINLIQPFSFDLNTNKTDFVNNLRRNVDLKDIDGMFSTMFEAFEKSENTLKGSVSFNEFSLKKRQRFFDRKAGLAKAIGKYDMKGEKLQISGYIKAWSNFMYFFFAFLLLFYTIFIFGFFLNVEFSENTYIPVIFIIIHALFMIGIPYYVLKSSIKDLKKEIEREFHFIVSKNINI